MKPALLSLLFGIVAFSGLPPAAQAQTTTRVSVDSLGAQASRESSEPSFSADGRLVVFSSEANNLVSGDSNGSSDIFLHDRQTGLTTRLSEDSLGVLGNGDSTAGVISADGRHVAFVSVADNLVPGDTNGVADIFVHDLRTGWTTRVSVDSSGGQADDWSRQPALSANGRYVAFACAAGNLVPGDTNGQTDVFVHDRKTGRTTRVSVDEHGAQGDAKSLDPSLSADGRFVAFSSLASNLVPGDTNFMSDIFVYDRKRREISRVNLGANGAQGNANSYSPAVAADGSRVAYWSYATNLVAGDTNLAEDVFVYDRKTALTIRVNVTAGAAQSTGPGRYPAISADGRHVAYQSPASDLVAGDLNSQDDVYVYDTLTAQVTRVSVSTLGAQAYFACSAAAISADGRQVAFHSSASNLVPGDTNGVRDVFVHDRGPAAPILTSTGACPGAVTLLVADATAHGNVAFVYGTAGVFVKSRPPCQGLVLDLAALAVAATLPADAAGTVRASLLVPPGACGIRVQAVDLASCAPSNAAVL